MKLFSIAVLFSVLGFMVFGDYDFAINKNGGTTSLTGKTYANGQTDTLDFVRTPNLSGASLSFWFGDSVDIQRIVVKRVVNGTFAPAQSADTLTAGDSLTAAGSRAYTLTLTPLAEIYKIFVSYDNDGGGVASGQDNDVNYYLNRQYNYAQ